MRGGPGHGTAAGEAERTPRVGTIEQLANGRWRLKVSHDGRKVTYGTYATEDEAATAQARWKLTGLLPADDPQVEMPASVAVGGVRCDEWFERWQDAKRARSSIVRSRPPARRRRVDCGEVGVSQPSDQLTTLQVGKNLASVIIAMRSRAGTQLHPTIR